jgi:2-hydroxy-6-oxonona-2,4-dienedioate hydrolase
LTIERGRLEAGGRRVSYRAAGPATEGAVVAVVTAGLGLSSLFYEASYGAFAAAGVRLVVPDLPGRGETPGPATGLGPYGTASFLIEFADAARIDRAVWIGHSLGAQAVTELAARWPDRTLALVLVGPTGAPGRFRLARQVWGLAVEARRASFDVIRAVAREYVRTSPFRYLGTWIRHAHHDMPALLPLVHCPTLILAGDRDPVTLPDFVELLGRGLPHARIQRVRDGTHALPRGCADEFNRAVLSFIHKAAGE